MIHRIYKYPEPILKKHAAPVKNIDGRLAQFLDDMAETMYAAPGVGLAAPQVGLSERVIVVDCDSEEDKKEGRGRGLLKLVNPEIIEADGAIVWEEGCLSVVDFTAEVNRAARVLLRAFTPDEKEVRIEAEGLLAVALQHEIDHLDGKLFIDRLSRLKRDLYKRKIKKMQKDGRFEEAAAKRPTVHI
ncbi:MAG: peptide deformylase [Candidatus Binatia bacterium]